MSDANDQPSIVDLVSAIGTWLAVGLALVALIGVVGPILVWRATKTEQNRALNEIDDEGAETFGYIGRGLWTGHKVRIFRAIRAPILTQEPELSADHLTLRLASQDQQPSDLSTDWIQFGSLVEGYGIRILRGDTLVVQNGHAFLPVHTSWVLLIGLVGRYGKWQDKGMLPSTIARGISSTQAQVQIPAGRTSRSRSNFIAEDERYGTWTARTARPFKRSSTPWEDRNDRRRARGVTYRPLYGLTGIFFFPSTSGEENDDTTDHLFFSRHKAKRVGQLNQESLGIDMLFWLSVGCLPIGDTIICLTDVRDVHVLPEPTRPQRAPVRYDERPRNLDSRFKPPRIVGFGIDTSSDESSEDIFPSNSDARFRPYDSAYIAEQPNDPSSNRSVDVEGLRVFHLSPWNDRQDRLSDFSSIVYAERTSNKVISLREVALSEADANNIISGNEGTYIARDLPWIRLNTFGSVPQRLLRRSDGQLFAMALLELELCPYGYLISKEPSWSEPLLRAAANSLPQLLVRVLWNIDSSYGHLNFDERNHLHEAMRVVHHMDQISSTRRYFDTIYTLDKALGNAIKPNSLKGQIANISLGCVMLTSPEFQSIISQSARLLSEGFNGTIEFDLEKSVIKVHTVMNFVSQFPVDFDVLFPRAEDIDRTGTVQMSLADVLLICQRAALRSMALIEYLDSGPLFKAVSRLSKKVYIN
jgi:hypothetical protein